MNSMKISREEKNGISKELLRQLFRYDGYNLIWKFYKGGSSKVNKKAGHMERNGYRRITLYKKGYNHSRLVWIYHKGYIIDKLFIDHKDRNSTNDNINNLRMVTNQENQFNTYAKGISWNKNCRKWEVNIQINRINKYLGRYKDKIYARNLYLKAKKKYHIIERR